MKLFDFQELIAAHDPLAPHRSPTEWGRTATTLTEAGDVLATDHYQGDGTPMREHLGVDTHLGMVAFGVRLYDVTATLWRHADDIRTIHDGHSVEWDGSNHRGKLTEKAQAALERVRDALEELMPDARDYIGQVADYCDGLYGDEIAEATLENLTERYAEQFGGSLIFTDRVPSEALDELKRDRLGSDS